MSLRAIASLPRLLTLEMLPMLRLVLLALTPWMLVAAAVAQDRPVRESIEWCDLWVTAADKPDALKVLLIGDSIVRGYYGVVEEQLRGRANCARLATSKCVADPAFLDELRLVLGHGPFVAIHFNNGLHGFDYSEEQYRAGLTKALDLLHEMAPGAQVIWANTTPIRQPGDLPKLVETTASVVEPRNRIAAQLMQSRGIPLDDLYTLGREHPEFYLGDGVHFNDAGKAEQGRQVAAIVSQALPPVPSPNAK